MLLFMLLVVGGRSHLLLVPVCLACTRLVICSLCLVNVVCILLGAGCGVLGR